MSAQHERHLNQRELAKRLLLNGPAECADIALSVPLSLRPTPDSLGATAAR